MRQGERYGNIELGRGKKVQVEFVSANPTGPLHVGHGRGAAFGASLANVLEAAGFAVAREYYVNDAGRQMDILAVSTWLRYLELSGLRVAFPRNAYQGEYVRDMARAILSRRTGAAMCTIRRPCSKGCRPQTSDAEGHLDGLIANAKRILGDDYAYVHDFALTEQLGDMPQRSHRVRRRSSMQWFSERSLYDAGHVERAIARAARRPDTST